MRCFLISDNIDTKLGMKLAGIDGVVVHEREEILSALENAMNDKETAVILITKKLTDLCSAEIYDYKLNRSRPLIVEIPDRHGDSNISDTISDYVSEAIGLKI
ncbi:MAG: V-type ATP synthase subunit F [Ruminiclostridium sp.]|nr:V-type ATP synthase subunit F [Ruminiclostridium sp.]MBQ8841548.1 V-type ATP synthase subunit F [Ruminiclostridium sp.]